MEVHIPSIITTFSFKNNHTRSTIQAMKKEQHTLSKKKSRVLSHRTTTKKEKRPATVSVLLSKLLLIPHWHRHTAHSTQTGLDRSLPQCVDIFFATFQASFAQVLTRGPFWKLESRQATVKIWFILPDMASGIVVSNSLFSFTLLISPTCTLKRAID